MPTPSSPLILASHLSTTKQVYKLNKTGAIQQPCLKPLCTLISSTAAPSNQIVALYHHEMI